MGQPLSGIAKTETNNSFFVLFSKKEQGFFLKK